MPGQPGEVAGGVEITGTSTWILRLPGRGASGTARLPLSYGHTRHPVNVRTVYRCRACPDQTQQAMLARTFGCMRMVWELDAGYPVRAARRRAEEHVVRAGRPGAEQKKDPAVAFLSEVSSALQRALRHQDAAFSVFFVGRARFPRFNTQYGRQAATYTRPAFRMKIGTPTSPSRSSNSTQNCLTPLEGFLMAGDITHMARTRCTSFCEARNRQQMSGSSTAW